MAGDIGVRERALQALYARIQAHAPRGASVRRNDDEIVGADKGGWVCLTDGEAEVTGEFLSPAAYEFMHTAQLRVVIGDVSGAKASAELDKIFNQIAAGIAEDPQLGGTVMRAEMGMPEPENDRDGKHYLIGGLAPIYLEYQSSTRHGG